MKRYVRASVVITAALSLSLGVLLPSAASAAPGPKGLTSKIHRAADYQAKNPHSRPAPIPSPLSALTHH